MAAAGKPRFESGMNSGVYEVLEYLRWQQWTGNIGGHTYRAKCKNCGSVHEVTQHRLLSSESKKTKSCLKCTPKHHAGVMDVSINQKRITEESINRTMRECLQGKANQAWGDIHVGILE